MFSQLILWKPADNWLISRLSEKQQRARVFVTHISTAAEQKNTVNELKSTSDLMEGNDPPDKRVTARKLSDVCLYF